MNTQTCIIPTMHQSRTQNAVKFQFELHIQFFILNIHGGMTTGL